MTTGSRKIPSLVIGMILLGSFFFQPIMPILGAPLTDVKGVAVAVNPQSASTSNITLQWNAIPPANGGSVTYQIDKSADGGVSYTAALNTADLAWTDNGDGSGLPNYSNFIYRLQATEIIGGNTYTSVNYKYVNVFPPDTNAHDNYLQNTNICNSCHSTHKAKSPYLLNQLTASAVCLTCHSSFTNSKYNVIDGYTRTGTGISPSLGGAFAHNGVEGDVWNGAATTSAHTVDEQTPGAGPGGANVNQLLGCTTCHSGHATGNYRLLKESISVPTGAQTYTTVDIQVQAGAATASSSAGESPVYISGITTFCQSCHADYSVGSGSGSTNPPTSQYNTPGTYRHAVGITPASKALSTTLPLEGTARNNDDTIVCLTCHYAHGTVSTDSTVSKIVAGDGSTYRLTTSTSLKRLAATGICENCHNK